MCPALCICRTTSWLPRHPVAQKTVQELPKAMSCKGSVRGAEPTAVHWSPFKIPQSWHVWVCWALTWVKMKWWKWTAWRNPGNSGIYLLLYIYLHYCIWLYCMILYDKKCKCVDIIWNFIIKPVQMKSNETPAGQKFQSTSAASTPPSYQLTAGRAKIRLTYRHIA